MANGGISPKAPDWSALTELAKMPEPHRRRVLRSHVEAGIHSTDELDLRRRLDEELEWLARQELRAEIGSDVPSEVSEEVQLHFEKLVWESPAFAQYLNTYLYFGIRFAAERVPSGAPAEKPAPSDEQKPKFNEGPVGLPVPPAIEPGSADQLSADVERFLSLNGQDSPETQSAKNFLDDYPIRAEKRGEVSERPEPRPGDETNLRTRFDLWVRGLLLPGPQDLGTFQEILRGMYDWSLQRYKFFFEIERNQIDQRLGRPRGAGESPARKIEDRKDEHPVDPWIGPHRAEGGWHAHNPLAARCAVTDLYWLAKVLRAEVSPQGVVRYPDRSWLHYVLQRFPNGFPDKPDGRFREKILRIEDVLRSAFDFGCELIANAVEISDYREKKKACPIDYPNRPSGSLEWRCVEDQENDQIYNQRVERFYPEHVKPRPPRDPGDACSESYWSRRARTGDYEENLVGVALSGGGIRSATFALGVLERLRELDLLRQVDYLSTVSGGGYIGAWLVGNVYRTRYWLSRMTSWEDSIDYLRNYSKYLSPQSGLLSADTWVIWVTWIRNTILIQLTTLAWLSAAFVLAIGLKALFDWCGREWAPEAVWVLRFLLLWLAARIGKNLWEPTIGGKIQKVPPQARMAALAWCSSFLVAALFWNYSPGYRRFYSTIFLSSLDSTFVVAAILLFWLALCSLSPGKRPLDSVGAAMRAFHKARPPVSQSTGPVVSPINAVGKTLTDLLKRSPGAAIVALLSFAAMYLCLCGVRYLFDVWASWGSDYSWYAYVFGPTLVMLAATLGVVVFIGLVGRDSLDWKREWWTRYGALLAMGGTLSLALATAAVFGYVWLAALLNLGHQVSWTKAAGAAAAWIASSTAGLLAGNSSKTRGTGGESRVLEWVARLGGLLFIVGAAVGLSGLLHVVLVQVWLDNPQPTWPQDLDHLFLSGPSGGRFAHFAVPITFAAFLLGGLVFSRRFDLNTFGLNQFYRNRLVRCYLGATRWLPGMRGPDGFTGFDKGDDLKLTQLKWSPPRPSPPKRDEEIPFRGPFPIINCSLNLGGSSDLAVKTRQSASFTMTPLYCGAARPHVGFARIDKQGGFADGIQLGEAISISGAAASPNMGYHTSPLVSILLTMFNVRLAWWFRNPGLKGWDKNSPPGSVAYLLNEFLGLADETSAYINVSDGGHFENLGIYELVRRRTKVIIASDAECDPDLSFGSLGNVIRLCETDFDAKIDIDVASIHKQGSGNSGAHCAIGRITYRNGSQGYLIYLKASITGDESPDLEQYRAQHPDFPHQTTADQFFTEDQFESYRRLGDHAAKLTFRDVESGTTGRLVEMAARLYDMWTPTSISSDSFVKHAELLDKIWERFRRSEALGPLLDELVADRPSPPFTGQLSRQDLSACLELTQLMENVFLDLRLDDFWDHPDNRGWAMLFSMWAKSPMFRQAWETIHRTFGIRFEYFCERRLGLRADHPVERV